MRTTVLACLALALVPAFAQAHTSIESVTPRSGSTVPRSLAVVSVTFKAAIVGGSLSVTSPAGKTVSVGKGRIVSGRRVLRVSLRSGLKAGRYTARVGWVSPDGHVDTKTWRFRVR